jgi:Outer membrane protein beta-barrel domain
MPMSKFAVIFLILICINQSYSQTHFGIKGGINYNDIVIENAPFLPISLYRPNIGFHVGLFTRIRIASLHVNPELLFVQRGCNSSTFLFGAMQPGAFQAATDTRINLNYIELPLLVTLFRFKLISLEAGPNTSVKLSAKEISDNGKKDVSDRFNKPFDFGISGGVKAIIGQKISIAGRYYHGLGTVLQFPLVAPNTYPTSSSRNIQFSLHYLL